MRFTYSATVPCIASEVFTAFEHFSRDHGLLPDQKGEHIEFATGGFCGRYNFDAYQLVDEGVLTVRSTRQQEVEIRYDIRALRAWFLLPLWAIVGVLFGVWSGVLGLILTFVMVYLQQRYVFHSFIRSLSDSQGLERDPQPPTP